MAVNNLGQVEVGFATCASKKVTLTAANSVEVLAAKETRMYASIINNSSASVTLILGNPSNSSVGQGIILTGRSSSYEIDQNNLYRGRISAVAANTVELSIVECER